jgi:TolB-like protein/DNA-binding SARP family transcriptional activator/Flp pilus assembly protein TadD
MPRARLTLFGAPSLADAAGARIESLLAQPKRFAVLAYLAVEARESPVSRDKVATLFWPELDQQRARQSLRQSLHVIRGELGDDVITGVGAELVALNAELIGSDVAEFSEAIKAADDARALEAYRGHLLDGFFVSDSPDFENWVSQARGDLRSKAVGAAKRLVSAAVAGGDSDAAIRRLTQQLAIGDLDEPPLRQLMTLLRKQGNPAAAVSAFDAYAERMHRELEVEPSEETAKLAAEIRAEIAASGPPPGRAPSSYTPGLSLPSAGDNRVFKPLLAIVATTLLLAAIGGVWWRGRLAAAADAGGAPSVAVLPFLDLSPARDQQYLTDGLTEELITALSQVRGLRVTARTSSFAYRNAQADVPRIGRELRVTSVLEGSVRREGENLRVTAQLIDTRTGFHLWADNFDRKAVDLIKLQDEIAAAIARALRVQLVGPTIAAASGDAPARAAAHEAYLRGRFFWNQRNPDGIRTAIDLFRQAVQRDSSFAPAWAGLASAYQLAPNFTVLSPDSAFPRAIGAVQRALALDPDLAEAHASLGFIKLQWLQDQDGAEKDLRKATELAPGYATAWQWLRLYFVGVGKLDSALASAKRARELDPASLSIVASVGDVFYYMRQFDSAAVQYGEVLKLDPEFDRVLASMSRLESVRGRHADAIGLAERAIAKPPRNARYVGNLALIYGRAGRSADARRILDTLRAMSKRSYVPPYAMILAHAGIGSADSTIYWIERAVSEKDAFAIELWPYPEFDSIAKDPRYVQLSKRAGWPARQ